MIVLVSRRGKLRYCLGWPDPMGAYILDMGTGKVSRIATSTYKAAYRPTADLAAARQYFNEQMDRLLQHP